MKYDFDKEVDRESTHSMKWEPDFLKAQFGDADLLPLWVADMDFKCPQPVIDALMKRVEHGIYGYSQRDDSYYQAIIDWTQKRHGWKIKKDWLVFSPGIVPAINYLIQTFCYPGDRVIIQNPVYYPFFNAISNNGCHPVYNQLKFQDEQYTMDFDDLEEKVKDPRVKLLILCNPHNPVGRVWSKEELKKLGDLCIKNDVIIISDEIHSDLILKGHKHVCFADISEAFAQNSITCTAPSKTFNLAGLQTSNLIIPNQKLRKYFSQTLERNNVGLTNCFGIVALTAAYNQGQDWLEQVLEYLESNVDFIENFVKEKMPEIKFIRPQGTYLAWLDFRAVTGDAKSLEAIIQGKGKIALDEGYIFGKGGEGFERINFACPKSILEKALTIIEKTIHSKTGVNA